MKGGEIAFRDPRGPVVAMYETPGIDLPWVGSGMGLPFTPTTGQLLIFPAWLEHRVERFEGPTERISIALMSPTLDPFDHLHTWLTREIEGLGRVGFCANLGRRRPEADNGRCDRQITKRPAGQSARRGREFILCHQRPAAERFFRFGEAEHFIAQQLDGTTSSETVRHRVEERFGTTLSVATLEQFIERLRGLGLVTEAGDEPRLVGARRRRIAGDLFIFVSKPSIQTSV